MTMRDTQEREAREAFERWASDDDKTPSHVARNATGGYTMGVTSFSWVTWQAAWSASRASLPAAPAVPAITDEEYCHLEYVEGSLAAIANRSEQVADTIERIDSISRASGRAKEALRRFQAVAPKLAALNPSAPGWPPLGRRDQGLPLPHGGGLKEQPMAAAASLKMVVLYEDEVRIAAKALDAFRELAADETSGDDAKDQAWIEAARACMVALAGAEDDGATLVLANKRDLLGRAAHTTWIEASIGSSTAAR